MGERDSRSHSGAARYSEDDQSPVMVLCDSVYLPFVRSLRSASLRRDRLPFRRNAGGLAYI